MKKARFLPLLLLLQALAPEAAAQMLEQRISVQYANTSISDVLSGISKGYGTRFAYSSDFVPVSRRVSVTARNEPLRQVLDRIFEDQPVQYADINGQVVLKVDRRQFGQLELPKAKPVQTSPLYPQALSREELAALKRQRERWEYMAAIELRRAERLEGAASAPPVMPQPVPVLPAGSAEDELTHRLAQISLLPLIGTNALRSMEITNNLSLNVLWGVSGGLSGLEIGGFGNTVLGDVTGLQVAGIGNIVGGDVVGTQVSGLFNIGSGRVQGVQAAGLFNLAGDIDAVQAASLFNIASGKMTGVQAAGLFNIAGGGADGYQGSSLFNISNGNTRAQTAALFNVAHDVNNAQVSLLFNRAKRVDGFQFAIVNIADTVAGVPIGLFNFVRHGYNRVEIATTESFYANLGFKFGAHSFYNILQVGARWESLRSPTLDGLYWGVGYGFGTTASLSRRMLLNTELLAMHINEEERWTRSLNLLGQLRFTFDFRVSSNLSFFAGPSANLMLTRRYDPDTGEYGSGLPPETIWEGRIGNAQGQGWIGFTAGIRM